MKGFSFFCFSLVFLTISACGGGGNNSDSNSTLSNSDPSETITIKTNSPPQILSSDELFIDEEEQITLALSHLKVNDVDNPLKDLTLKIRSGDNYSFTGTQVEPHQDYVGTLSIPVVVSDGEDDSAEHTVKISVSDINDSPRAFNKTVGIKENNNQLIELEGVDVEDDATGKKLTYEIVDYPEFGTLTEYSGAEFIYKNTSDTAVSDSFTYRAIDSLNAHSNHARVSINIESADDIGSVVIHGNPVVGQTLTATVIDGDGYESSQVAYQWRHNSKQDFSALSLSDQSSYTLTENDIGKRITVIAEYVDNGATSNTVRDLTEKTVVPLPVIKKTISIIDAQPGSEIINIDQLREGLMLDNGSGYTLKEVSIDSLMGIAANELPDTAQSNASSSNASNSDHIYGHTKIEKNFENLEESTLFQITPQGDIKLNRSPELYGSFVGSGNKKVLIGKSYTLGIFSDSTSLKGLINIRFSPSTVMDTICLNPVGDDSSANTPVVLVHGWMGFDKAELASALYWNKLDQTLATVGNTQVFSAKVDPWAVPETRGEQLIAYIKCVLSATNKDRVDLIGHSLGSPTARYASYWLDNHEGHTPKNAGNSEVRSVISVSGTNYGGNMRVVDKAHMLRVADKANQLYKANIVLRDFSIRELIFKFIKKSDISNKNTNIGKQYQLAIDLLDQLSGDSGLLVSVKSILSASDPLINKLVADTDNEKGIVTQWLGSVTVLYKEKSVQQDMLNNIDYLVWGCMEYEGQWPLRECKKKGRVEAREIVNNFFSALNEINTGLTDTQSHTNVIKTEIPSIINGLREIKIELEELNSQTHDPDYSALLTELKTTQQAVSKIKPELEGLKGDIKTFANGLNDLATVLQDYKNFDEWLRDIGSLESLIGLDVYKVGQLKDVVGDFYDVMANNLGPLLEASNQLLADEDLIKELFSEEESTKTSAIKSIAGLLTDSESLVAKFKLTIEKNASTLSNLHPKWGDHFTTSLNELVNPLNNVKEHITTTTNSIDGIKTMLKVAMGEYEVDWQDIVSWQINEIQKIKSSLTSDFLASNAAVKYGLNQTNFEQCITTNLDLKDYFESQEQNKNESRDYELPTLTELNTAENDCATVINNIINAVVDNIVPLNEINPYTNKQRYKEVLEGFYAVSGFGSQMFNLKYPDTGLSLGRYKRCLNDPDFSQVNYENNNRVTKYYSIIAKRDSDPRNFADRITTNMFVSASNPSAQDTIDRPSDLMASLLLIDRQVTNSPTNNPTHDMTLSQIKNLFANTDLVVPTCSQELGHVISLDNSRYTQNFNHDQMANRSLLAEFATDLTDLASGKKVEGYSSIKGELATCNQSVTVTDRKECVSDLFARIIIMYATAKAIDGSQINVTTKTLGLFDIIEPLVQDKIDMQGVDGVPKLYESFFQWVQRQND